MSKSDKAQVQKTINRRNLFLFAVQGLGFYALGSRAYDRQVTQRDKYATIAENNRIATRLEAAPRGLVLDAKGRRIADNTSNFKLYYDKREGQDHDLLLANLSKIVAIDVQKRQDLRKLIEESSSRKSIPLMEYLTYSEFISVTENLPNLPGCHTNIEFSRIYPFHMLFAHHLGYVGRVSSYDLERMVDPDPIYRQPDAKMGKSGLELLMEDDLRGEEGRIILEKTPSGISVRELERHNSTPGDDIQITLDAEFQNFAAKRLDGEAASAVIINIENGNIELMASAPSFDPNPFVLGISQKEFADLQNNIRYPLYNKSVSGQYPPASTFKMVVALAGLEVGAIHANSGSSCRGKINRGRDFHCWKRSGHGYVGVKSSLKHSCDIFYYEHAEKTGIQNIVKTARELGLGEKFDLPLNLVRPGLLGDIAWKKETYGEDWVVGDTFNAGIGQGFIEATPLQLAVMTARIASGKKVVPQMIKSIGGAPKNVEFEPLSMQPQNLKLVREAMWDVANVSDGTAYGSRIVGDYIWAGKTGTAQTRNISKAERERGVISNKDLEWALRDHALFVAFAPYDNPKYAISVIIEHGGGGSSVAAPVARDLMLYALYGGPPPLSAYPAHARSAAAQFMSSVPKLDEVRFQLDKGDPRGQASKTSGKSNA